MQCPFCGSEGISEDVVFCPHCRYQFRPETGPVQSPAPYRENGDAPAPDEIRIVEALLVQPAVILMIFFSAGLYLAVNEIAALSVTVSGTVVRYGSVVCLLAGTVAAWVVYRLMLVRLRG